MSEDDICGAPTAEDEPCQNPATEGDSCWLAEHGGDSAPSGRPSLLEEYEDDILAAAREGLTYEGIARVAGIGVSTLHDWREEHPQFSEALERARSQAERDLIRDVDPEFVLERSYGYVKTEKREVDVDADVDATHDVTADFVTFGGDDGDE
jgi:transposase-like protein